MINDEWLSTMVTSDWYSGMITTRIVVYSGCIFSFNQLHLVAIQYSIMLDKVGNEWSIMVKHGWSWLADYNQQWWLPALFFDCFSHYPVASNVFPGQSNRKFSHGTPVNPEKQEQPLAATRANHCHPILSTKHDPNLSRKRRGVDLLANWAAPFCHLQVGYCSNDQKESWNQSNYPNLWTSQSVTCHVSTVCVDTPMYVCRSKYMCAHIHTWGRIRCICRNIVYFVSFCACWCKHIHKVLQT